MRSAILGFVAGVGCLQLQARLPSLLLLCILGAGAIVLVVMQRHLSRNFIRITFLTFGGAGFGFAWAALFAHAHLSQELPAEWEGRDVAVIGVVDSLPYHFPQGMRFDFRVEQALDGAAVPQRLALSWYYSFQGKAQAAWQAPRPGERWQLTVRLRRPHGNANPYGFDYEVWLLERKLRATGTVRADDRLALKNQRLDDFVPGFRSVVERSRAALRGKIQAALPDHEYAGVIVALVIGDQRAISQSDWEVFNRSGINHLMSISGLHITMVAGMVAAVVYALWRRSFFTRGALPLILPAQKAAALAGMMAASIYVLLAGFGVPAQRTLYMLTVVAVALWMGRLAAVSQVLCVALAIVLLLDPWAVLWPGFWLSFGAVALILYVTVGRARHYHASGTSLPQRLGVALAAATRTQYAITIGLVPLTLLLFSEVSVVGPLANAIAIPVVSFVITPLALVGSILPHPLSTWVLSGAHTVLAGLAICLEWLSSLPLAVWRAPQPSPWMTVLAIIGATWMLAPRGWPMRWAGVLAWIPLGLNSPSAPPEKELWVTAFDVGQGSAVLVETANHRLLYDTGPRYSPEADGASRVILPYLQGRGIQRLDGVVISHGDLDHAGGAASLLKEVPVMQVWSSLPADSTLLQDMKSHVACAAGQSWMWDGVLFEMLHPPVEGHADPGWKPNARSCTLKLTLGKHAMLLPGDIERRQEAALVKQQADKLRATILLAPHHGSGTSSTPDFLRAAQPEIALFQVGYRNRYRHPKQEVYERYGDMGIRRIRTDESGAVSLRIGETMEVQEYRTAEARYWHKR
jgi:competence protein ComEC